MRQQKMLAKERGVLNTGDIQRDFKFKKKLQKGERKRNSESGGKSDRKEKRGDELMKKDEKGE